MNYTWRWQNLNEKKNIVVGSGFWHGRAWFHERKSYSEIFHIEWLIGRKARDFAIKISFGCGDSDAGICLHICLPFIFSLFFCIPNVYHCKESELGIKIHSQAIWLHAFSDSNEWSRDFPWWKQSHCWHFPWSYKHHLTEILTHETKELAQSVWNDKNKKFLEAWDERKTAEKSVSKVYDYKYTLKNGDVQNIKATVFVSRMLHRARWYPIIPLQRSCTSISIEFSGEVGEETGSWKGGCIGCSYDMLPNETPEDCLRRMEKERKF